MSRITFSILPGQRAEADRYAVAKGFGNVSSMARYAMFRFMGQYPLSGRKHGRRAGAGKSDGRRGEDAAEVLPEASGDNVGAAEAVPGVSS
jgi:hypothetical protein